MTAKTGAERTAESRERQRKAEGYDQAVSERDAAVAKAEEAEHQLTVFKQRQQEWLASAREQIAGRDAQLREANDNISVLNQQLAVLRRQLQPLAEAAPPRPEGPTPTQLRCDRCGSVNKVLIVRRHDGLTLTRP